MGDIVVRRVFLRQSQSGRQKRGVRHRWQRDWKEERRDGGIMDDNVRNRRGASERDYLIWLRSIRQRLWHRGEKTLRQLEKLSASFLLFVPQHVALLYFAAELQYRTQSEGEANYLSTWRRRFTSACTFSHFHGINYIPQIWDLDAVLGRQVCPHIHSIWNNLDFSVSGCFRVCT